MLLDGQTLLIVNLFIVSFATLIWFLSAFLFKTEPATSINFALANFVLGIFMVFYVSRTLYPHPIIFVLADITVVLGAGLLRRATEEFTGVKKQDKKLIALCIFIIISSVYVRFNEMRVLAVIVVTGSCFYGFWGTWKNAYNYMIKNFPKKYCITTTAPIFLMAVLIFLRVMSAIITPPNQTVTELTEKSNFNTGFLIIMIITTLGYNSTAIGLVISRMITQIRNLSQEDPLTKTFNRRHINAIAEEEINKIKKSNSSLSVILLDIDHFKKVNDHYGHAAGDAALVFCVDIIKKNIRSTDYVSRLGGEEFCVLLPNTSSESANMLAERIRANIEKEPVIWEEHKIPLTASFGITSINESNQDDWSHLLNKADIAMYQAKNNGRNQVVLSN